MKKKLLSAILAVVLIFSLAVPALAKEWSGTWGGVDYLLTATYSSTSGTVTMTAENVNVGVKAGACATVQVAELGKNVAGAWNTVYGDMTATSRVNNHYYDSEGNFYTGPIITLAAKGYVGETCVKTGWA